MGRFGLNLILFPNGDLVFSGRKRCKRTGDNTLDSTRAEKVRSKIEGSAIRILVRLFGYSRRSQALGGNGFTSGVCNRLGNLHCKNPFSVLLLYIGSHAARKCRR